MPKYQFLRDHKFVKGAKHVAGEVEEFTKEVGERLVSRGWARPVKETPKADVEAAEREAQERLEATEREADEQAAKARAEAEGLPPAPEPEVETTKPAPTTNKTTRRTTAKATPTKVEEADPDSDF